MDNKNLFETENKAYPGGFVINYESFDEAPVKSHVKESERNLAKEALEWIEVLGTAVIAVVIIFGLVCRVATISGHSMKNTLKDGEKIIISNLGYTPKNGDIVVISRNAENRSETRNEQNEPIIKRVIATGGQTVDINFEKGIVYVDGKALVEDYISTPTTRKHDVNFPLTVPEGHIFVLGDNRGDSLDSRFSVIGKGGLIDERYVLGHAIFRILPFDRIGRLDTK